MIRRATILAVGKLRGWSADASDDYAKRLRRYFQTDIIEIPEEDMNRRSAGEVISIEEKRLTKRIPDGAHLVTLDRARGKRISSEDLSRRLGSLGVSGRGHVAVVIGGPLGLSSDLLDRADEAWSFGEITLPHALARVVLLEQLYRAAKIQRNEKYHW